MRKKEVSGSSCIIPIFYISVLPFIFYLFFLIQEEAMDSNVRLKDQILILEGQKKEVMSECQKRCPDLPPNTLVLNALVFFTQLLLINEKWAREYRNMKQFYIEKVEKTALRWRRCCPNMISRVLPSPADKI